MTGVGDMSKTLELWREGIITPNLKRKYKTRPLPYLGTDNNAPYLPLDVYPHSQEQIFHEPVVASLAGDKLVGGCCFPIGQRLPSLPSHNQDDVAICPAPRPHPRKHMSTRN